MARRNPSSSSAPSQKVGKNVSFSFSSCSTPRKGFYRPSRHLKPIIISGLCPETENDWHSRGYLCPITPCQAACSYADILHGYAYTPSDYYVQAISILLGALKSLENHVRPTTHASPRIIAALWTVGPACSLHG